MRTKWFLSAAVALVIAMMAIPVAAQTISYINLLQFDLVSYRSQATAGMHDDDIEKVANAARLLEIDGNRLYTSFANLNDPATLGDNLITYSKDHIGNPHSADMFDTGSYLGGWIGKYDADSDYVFSVFYQRNHNRGMFEDLEDGNLGGSFGFSTDAEFTGTSTTEWDDGAGGNDADDQVADRDYTETADLMRYDDRSASNFDLGAAKELSSDLSVGARLFWEKDVLDRFAEGTTESISRSKLATDGALVVTDRDVTTYMGDGEEAYKNTEMGLSFDADYHPWSHQSFNVRLDVFGTNLTNPSSSVSFPTRGGGPTLPPTPFDPTGFGVAFVVDTDYDPVSTDAGDFPNGATLGSLDADHENSYTIAGGFSLGNYDRGFPNGIYSVDDERTGVGFNGLVEYDRACAGGDSRTWLGFSRRPYDVDATIVQRYYEVETTWWNAGGGDREATTTYSDETDTVTRTGDMSVGGWEVGSRWNRQMNNNVSFGCGLVVTRNGWKEEFTQTLVEVDMAGFDDGDAGDNTLFTQSGNGAHNENSAVQTTTSSTNVDHTSNTTTTRLPVGVTFRWGDGGKYGWNMGVTHNVNNQSVETVFSDTQGRTVTVVNDVAGALVDETSYSSRMDTESGTITDKSRWNTTTYFYGFEWRPNDAAQINFNGFLDTHGDVWDSTAPFGSGQQISDVDFWRNMAVSMTFFFL